VAFALVAAACGSSPAATSTTNGNTGAASTSGAAGSAAATVKTASTSQGTVLVNGSGMALYTYGPDHGGAQSACAGTCIQAWPPLTVPTGTTPSAGAGVTGTLGTARQSDGALQVTYDGNLLYTFLSDSSPGQVTGNGVAGFSVAKPAAAKPAAAQSATTTTSTSSGYQY
jgi:predicted lipoprotein with Yx(FWY)xxD motif